MTNKDEGEHSLVADTLIQVGNDNTDDSGEHFDTLEEALEEITRDIKKGGNFSITFRSGRIINVKVLEILHTN